MLIRFRQEEGVAMVIALMVSFAVLLLSTAVVAQSIHDGTASSYDRRRLQSVNSAEAGLDYYYNYLAKTAIGSLTANQVTISVGGSPGISSVTITPTYFSDAAGTTAFVPPFTSSHYPLSVRINTTATTNGVATRKMASFVVLHPVFAGLTGTIISQNSMTTANSMTVNGFTGNDGDIYVLTGNYSATSGNQTIKGNLYVPNGSITLSTSLHLYGAAWANTSVTSSQSQVQIDGDADSTTSSVTISSGHVNPGGANYCTTLTGSANIAGAKVQTCSLGPPPTQPFPTIRYSPNYWQDSTPSYTNIQTFTGATACTDARDYVQSTGAYASNGFSGHSLGNTVVYINANCTYTNTNNTTITLNGNLAIVTEGAINLSQSSTWNGATSNRDLFFMSAYPATGTRTCTNDANLDAFKDYDVSIGNNSNFNNMLSAFAYTPCTLYLSNNNTAFPGQAVGGTVVVGNNFTEAYHPIIVPGVLISSFTQDISYIREVR
ncbi:MAG: hypothetical protein M3P11_11825 [Actinomycetota bacterium]|nr:hypothetical protein [Actinomycetota bacterium]